ncbi:hypothetical protein COU78_03260 [Candidatus Peregrinibacteria bacterium CG10_big_fil_rev_8_21_14_0_10_49_24]|nr:MAG: hypothetical protein COV83_05080 [Candidatus Peregrinibacteria bacterium CG11_big_fil_rev_8_21_14_0_20_49_14]PIR51143.1 MAG: hypothetical protein COU78_03260 [Candidatus Peregrinibacteria bacterium CG10_big_fil_rev_8_21_14_0_10_49_24]PJA67182.1 MAG: hypothetical protein CO157_05415 [Candidatus Peregrinibacteria bacterium CG_4_9_14_3_um_filter_49_12]
MRKILSFSIFLLAPVLAYAAPGVDPCGVLGVGYCDATMGQTIINNSISQTGLLFAGIAGGAAVLFGVIGGAQMLLSLGNESQVTKGRNALIFALGGFALVLASQAIVSFSIANAQSVGLNTSTNPFITLMSAIVTIMLRILNSIFVIVMVGAGIRMIIGHGKSDEFNKAKQTLIFAVGGAFVINVAHALVRGILATGFGA